MDHVERIYILLAFLHTRMSEWSKPLQMRVSLVFRGGGDTTKQRLFSYFFRSLVVRFGVPSSRNSFIIHAVLLLMKLYLCPKTEGCGWDMQEVDLASMCMGMYIWASVFIPANMYIFNVLIVNHMYIKFAYRSEI